MLTKFGAVLFVPRGPDLRQYDTATEVLGTRGSVVSQGTILQAGRSRVRFSTRMLNFFNLPKSSSRTVALGSTKSLTEVSTRNFPRG
jgi:hypothetical protein